MIKVQIPAPLRSLTEGADEVEVEAADIVALVESLESRHRGLKARLCDDSGELRSYVRLFLNEEDIRFLGGESCSLKEGDRVLLVPSIAGG